MKLFREVVGEGPAILMMHAVGLDHAYLRAHDALADEHRVIYYDHRGNGRSPREGELTHAQWHADAAALLDELGEDRATIYGHSYGAWLALGFALAYPQRVERLVLCGGSPQFDYAPEAIANAQALDPTSAAKLVQALSAPLPDDAALETMWRACLQLYFHGPANPALLDGTIFSASAFAAAMAELATFATEPRLPELPMRVLILTGTYDYITPPKHARRLLAAPHATYVEFADSGHFPFAEEPDRYLDVLRTWLR